MTQRTAMISGLLVLAALAGNSLRAAENATSTAPSDRPPGAAAPSLAVAPFDAGQARIHQDAWVQHLRQPREIATPIGLKLVLIPPGEFMMGSPETEFAADFRRPQEEKQHRARITRPFYLAVCEVTQDEFDRIMGYNPSYRGARMARSKQNYDVDTSRYPVERVSWTEAQEFCRRLSELPGEKAAGHVYRLPTEAEWEYACRAGTTTAFPFGPMLDGSQANVYGRRPFGTDVPGQYLNRPTTVGSYPANGFGLFDMIGNKWEWCADWYDTEYYTKAPVDDPQGPQEGKARVIRGGAWRYPAAYCRSAMRYAYDPRIRAYDLGFRVALSLPGSPANPAQTQPATQPLEKHPDTRKAEIPVKETPGGPARGKPWTSAATDMQFVWIESLGIWVGKYETTNGEYRKKEASHNTGEGLNGDRQPAAMLSFEQAKAFAEWLTARDREQGRLPEGYCYRIPSEDEWLTFARCGQDVEFPWGNAWPPAAGNYRGQETDGRGDKIPNHKDEFPASCDVEKSGVNSWGLFGVGGNVWEACAEDRTGAESGAWRGGSWDSGTPGLLRCTFRSVGMSTYRFPNYGFRLVLSPVNLAPPSPHR